VQRENSYALATLRFHDNNAITAHVGPENVGFTIYPGPICDASAYFDALFEDSFKESSEKVVTFSEHAPETFDQFLGSLIPKSWPYCFSSSGRKKSGWHIADCMFLHTVQPDRECEISEAVRQYHSSSYQLRLQ
jgi:hypothetical protein